MNDIKDVAVLGAGVIGASWAALFLSAGKRVAVFDPMEGAEASVRAYVENAWPTLVELGLAKAGDPSALSFHDDPRRAVETATFIQESVPERIEIKHALFQEVEPALRPETIFATSASGLTLTEMQAGWRAPDRFVLGHPFNPPHLIPLVEVMGNERTDPSAVESAEQFYQSVGKVTIRVGKEIPGHVSNRLQAALWREAIHLVNEGVASVEDVNKAVWAGPGLRWAAMGPTMIFHLAAGEGGLKTYCERFADSFHRWWDDLGDVRFDPAVVEKLAHGVAEEARGGRSRNARKATRRSHRRDAKGHAAASRLTRRFGRRSTRPRSLHGVRGVEPPRTRRSDRTTAWWWRFLTSKEPRAKQARPRVGRSGRPRGGVGAADCRERKTVHWLSQLRKRICCRLQSQKSFGFCCAKASGGR